MFECTSISKRLDNLGWFPGVFKCSRVAYRRRSSSADNLIDGLDIPVTASGGNVRVAGYDTPLGL